MRAITDDLAESTIANALNESDEHRANLVSRILTALNFGRVPNELFQKYRCAHFDHQVWCDIEQAFEKTRQRDRTIVRDSVRAHDHLEQP